MLATAADLHREDNLLHDFEWSGKVFSPSNLHHEDRIMSRSNSFWSQVNI